VPLDIAAGEAIPDPRLHAGTPLPDYVETFDVSTRNDS
jgi:hypothetical protein